MPLRFDLTLTLERTPERELARHLHALVFALWRTHDPKGAAQHHAANASPFSLAIGPLEGGRLEVRLNLLEEGLLEVFEAVLTPQTAFGDGEALCGSLREVRRSGERYSSLLERALAGDAPRVLEWEFLSCTSLTSTLRPLLEPHPEPVFKGVLKRAQTFFELRYPPGLYAYLGEAVHLQDAQLERAEVVLERDQWVQGFVGRARYRLDRDTLEGRWVGFLAALAEYTGVGRRVAYGCGTLRSRVKDAWW